MKLLIFKSTGIVVLLIDGMVIHSMKIEDLKEFGLSVR